MNIKQLPSFPFYFARHGQTDWNKERKIMGQTDIPLNGQGIRQAQELAQQIKDIEISVIVASPLTRAHQTAQIIAEQVNKQIITIDELKECLLGELQGKHRDNNEELEYWMLGGTIEDAEHWHEFVHRVSIGLHKALNISQEKPILVVAHGAVYRAIQTILNLEMHAIDNCAFILHEPNEGNTWQRNYLNGSF